MLKNGYDHILERPLARTQLEQWRDNVNGERARYEALIAHLRQSYKEQRSVKLYFKFTK